MAAMASARPIQGSMTGLLEWLGGESVFAVPVEAYRWEPDEPSVLALPGHLTQTSTDLGGDASQLRDRPRDLPARFILQDERGPSSAA